MRLQLVKTLAKLHNISDTVTLMSDSGWECDATDMDCVYYNKEKNILVFTQTPNSKYNDNPAYECIYGYNKKF